MSKLTLKINVPGFNEARNDPRIQADLHRRAEAIAAAAGGSPDYLVIDDPHKTRARVVVVTATPEARSQEATGRTLSRAFDAGRG